MKPPMLWGPAVTGWAAALSPSPSAILRAEWEKFMKFGFSVGLISTATFYVLVVWETTFLD